MQSAKLRRTGRPPKAFHLLKNTLPLFSHVAGRPGNGPMLPETSGSMSIGRVCIDLLQRLPRVAFPFVPEVPKGQFWVPINRNWVVPFFVVKASRCLPRPVRFLLALRYTPRFSLP